MGAIGTGGCTMCRVDEWLLEDGERRELEDVADAMHRPGHQAQGRRAGSDV